MMKFGKIKFLLITIILGITVSANAFDPFESGATPTNAAANYIKSLGFSTNEPQELPDGSYAVLEVKTNELPFILEDGQTIARIKYEKLNKKTSVVYGSSINSNYQNQKLALSKHFK